MEFSITDPAVALGEVDQVNHTVDVEVPFGTPFDSLVAVVQLSRNAITNPDVTKATDYGDGELSIHVVARRDSASTITILDSTEYTIRVTEGLNPLRLSVKILTCV